MYCNQCGLELPDNYKFCPKCGAEITLQSKNTENKEEESVFHCGYCFETFSSEQDLRIHYSSKHPDKVDQRELHQPEKQKKKTSKKKIVLMIFVILVGLAIINHVLTPLIEEHTS